MPKEGDSVAFTESFNSAEHTIDLECKSLKIGPDGSFSGYLSFYNNVDEMQDIMLPSAFLKSLEEKTNYTLFYFHDPKEPVGVFSARTDKNGLRIDGQLEMKATPRAQSLARLIEMGAVRGLSPGYNVKKKSYSGGVRNLADVQLVEGSLTPFPANTKAMIDEFKSLYTAEEQKSCSLFGGCAKKSKLEGGTVEDELEDGSPYIEESKPYPNEHACRMRDPGEFEDGTMRRVTRQHEGKEYSIIMGRLKGETTMTEQAYRYDKNKWNAADAKTHCSSHEGGRFEAAAGEKSMSLDEQIETKVMEVLERLETKKGAVFNAPNLKRLKAMRNELDLMIRQMEGDESEEQGKSQTGPKETKTISKETIDEMRSYFENLPKLTESESN